MCGFTDILNWLGSSPGTALHIWRLMLRYELLETWVMIIELKSWKRWENALPVVVIGVVMDSMGRIVSVDVDSDVMDWLEVSGINIIT